MLYLVEDYDRWGFSLNVVRADSEEEAVRLVRPKYATDTIYKSRRPEVTPLTVEGTPGIVWCHDESPDT